MKRFYIFISAALAAICASAQLVAEKVDGSVTPLASGEITASGGEYCVGGIPVADIAKVYNAHGMQFSDILQPAEGSFVTMPASSTHHAVVLDMCQRSNIVEASSDNGRNVYSAQYMLDVAGIPYTTTDNLPTALADASLIVLSCPIVNGSFSDSEYDAITRWVHDGGILFSPAIETSASGPWLDLFGIKSVTPKKKTHSTICWIDEPLPELAYIDSPEERETYIGHNYIFTAIYTPGEAVALATYDSGTETAVTKHVIGSGVAYNIGVRWRDVIQRSQLNKGDTDRTRSNHFEASADVYPLFIRAAYAAHSDVAVWKHTIPDGYRSVLIPTHDCDSRSAYDEMHWLGDYEHSLGLRGHYFITVHYFRHPNYMSAFYNDETLPAVKALLNQGHTVGSHSIGHFPDFTNAARFPIVETTPEAYAVDCTYDPDTKTTTGGSTWAEIVMSKQIIQRDVHNQVRSFRSGHLAINANIPRALQMGGYNFASCYSANDLWGNFPFMQRLDNKWEADMSGVLQMPLHFSDVRPSGENMTKDNWQEALDIWKACYDKLIANYSPNILLIHPNSEWKMQLQKAFIEQLDLSLTGLYNFEDYGDFWLRRLDMDYTASYADGMLTVVVDTDDIGRYKGQGLFIETDRPLRALAVADRSGAVHRVRIVTVADGRYIAVL